MENSHSHSNGLSNNASYSQLPGLSSGVSPQQLQHNQTTLPPLQPQHAVATMQSAYSSAPHTPRTPATPNTPGLTSGVGGSQLGTQSRYPITMPGSNYQQYGLPGWREPASMLAHTMPHMPQHHSIAPAPASIQHRQQQPLRPMPTNGMQQQTRVSEAAYDQNTYLVQSAMMPEMDPPTHVVGSQGRRGILPSAPGRPAISTTAEWIKSFVPTKDNNGKYPCPCCVKTYLHAKHLKRHMMRHSGDRPYRCALCLDTFSRSDILKRHFAKCSKRRGNPENLSHLSQQQARVSKSAPGSAKLSPATSTESNPLGLGLHRISNDPGLHPFGVIADGSVPDAGSNMTDEQAQQQQQQLSRANSLHQLGNGGRAENRSMTYPGTMTTNRTNFDQSYSGGEGYAGGVVSTMPSTGMHPSLVVSMQNGQNGHSYSQGYDFASHGSGAMPPQSAADISALHHARYSMPMPMLGGVHGQQSAYQWPGSLQQVPNDGLMAQYDSSMRIKPEHYDPSMRLKSEPSTANSSSRSSTDGSAGGPWPSTSGVAGLSIC